MLIFITVLLETSMFLNIVVEQCIIYKNLDCFEDSVINKSGSIKCHPIQEQCEREIREVMTLESAL